MSRFTHRGTKLLLWLWVVLLSTGVRAEDPKPLVAPFDAAAAKAAQKAWAAKLGQKETLTNSLGMELALIPAGEFQMGSPTTEKGRGSDEQQHRVRLTKPFYLGVYAVTQEEYEKVMETNPSWFSSTGKGKATVVGLDTKRFPLENVSWDDAVEFCKRLSKQEGKTYRLPTEAEWEYACRAGTTTPFHFGNTLNGDHANCNGDYPNGTETKGTSLNRTTTVGSYKPNAFGLYDMHGNVVEWCSDRYDRGYYDVSPLDDPTGPAAGSYRVLRGGGWIAGAVHGRSASRFHDSPSFRLYNYGFRVVLVR